MAITAARSGARVTGLDLTKALLEQARANLSIARTEDIVWTEGVVAITAARGGARVTGLDTGSA